MLLNFSKAFSTINLDFLLVIFNYTGVGSTGVGMSRFLKDMSQFVVSGGDISEFVVGLKHAVNTYIRMPLSSIFT